MRDVGILEAAHHVEDRVHLADMREELVAKALALARAAHQAGDIDELQRRGHDLRRLADRRELVSRASGTATRPTFGSMVQNG